MSNNSYLCRDSELGTWGSHCRGRPPRCEPPLPSCPTGAPRPLLEAPPTYDSGHLWSCPCRCIDSLPLADRAAIHLGFPGGSDGKESACSTEDLGLIPGSARSPGEGNGYPLQYSCLKSMDRGAWWATVHGVSKESGTNEQLKLSLWDSQVTLVVKNLPASVRDIRANMGSMSG